MRDVAVIGGGPAGSALAIQLARAGRDVVLFDRPAAAHDKVCGEFLSGGAIAALVALGFDPIAHGAIPLHRVDLFAGQSQARAALPFPAVSLSRRVMDDALLRLAACAGVEVHRGVTIRRATRDRVDGDRDCHARCVVLATGKHELRDHPRRTSRRRWIGRKMHLHLPGGVPTGQGGSSQVFLFAGGYAGLQPVGDDRVNLCVALDGSSCPDLLTDWPSLCAGMMRRSSAIRPLLDGAVPCWDRPLTVAGVPYGFIGSGADDGLFRLGDQAAVIPSFCGDGISIALASARAAADAILNNEDASIFQRRFARMAQSPLLWAGLLKTLGQNEWGRTLLVSTGRHCPWLIAALAKRTRIAR